MLASLLLSCLLGSALSADILAVFPHTGKSHFDVFEPLIQTLASRGHSLTVISFFPQKTPLENYTDISLVGVAPMFVNALKFEHLTEVSPLTDFMLISNMGVQSCQDVFMFPPIQSLLQSSRRFDLLIVEMFNTDCFLAFVTKFMTPYIAISSSALFPTHYPRMGSFDNPSYFPNLFFPYTPRMSFAQRTVNFVSTLWMRFLRTFRFSVTEERVVRQAFGRDVSLQSVARNLSLAMVNSHFSLQGARPLPPGCIEVGGLHILPSKSLKKELDKFLNESAEGTLLFSMGSVLQSSSFPADKRQAFMDAFAELPVRVIMKWENETLPGKPDNVKLSKWLPQRDIMAHPKVVAFMGHGGLLSTSEAVYSGLPMVLIPMFGDQPNNVAHLVATGAAVRLSFQDISKDTVLQALRAVLFDARYKENARKLSEQYRDRPMSPLDTAVYWTEYVLRHKGAPHLRSAAVDMPWYQLWLLDVIAVLLTAFIITLLFVLYLAKRITSIVFQLLNRNKHKKD